ADDGIEASGDESAHIQDSSDLGAATPNAAPAALLAAVPVERCDSDQGSELLLAQGAELRDERQKSARQDFPDARDTPEEVVLLAPEGRAFDGVVQVAVDFLQLLLEPLYRLADRSPDCLRRRSSDQAVLLGGDHVDDLAATDHQSLQFLCFL